MKKGDIYKSRDMTYMKGKLDLHLKERPDSRRPIAGFEARTFL